MSVAAWHTDRLIFHGGPAGQEVVGWNGAWPPPQHMVVAYGSSGFKATYDPNDMNAERRKTVAELVKAGTRMEYYQLLRASTEGDKAKPGAKWFRGADYLHVGRN